MKRVVMIALLLLGGCAVPHNHVSKPAIVTTLPTAEPVVYNVTLPDNQLQKLARETAEEVDRKLGVRSNGILTRQPPPPYAEAYPNLTRDNIAFYDYVDDFNWYINYLFQYTIVLNDYAETRGWKPPEQVPICRIVNWQVMEDLPKFTPSTDPSKDLNRFEWELVDYIQTVKDKYKDELEEMTVIQNTQRLLCVY